MRNGDPEVNCLGRWGAQKGPSNHGRVTAKEQTSVNNKHVRREAVTWGNLNFRRETAGDEKGIWTTICGVLIT